MRVAYEAHGAGEPLVLVHGWCGSRSVWKLQVRAFAERYRVIAVDLRGHGDSDKPPKDEDYSIALCASDLADLLDALGIDRTILMGQSMGTLVCQQFCLTHPRRVTALVLAGALSVSPPAGQVVGPWVERIVEEVQAKGFEPSLREVVPFWFSPGFDPEVVRTVTADSFKAAPHAALAFCRAVSGTDLRERLPEIGVPTLLIVGERDGRTPVAEAEDMNRRIPDAWLKVIKGAGHMANVEKPEEWNRAVLAFLAAVR
ncbi:MAG: alpha/beta fold hydrolase [Dehalococcoidia bacterium]|nr:alpha/beta fold hydrolase [Dehalococcoidia bacterium]